MEANANDKDCNFLYFYAQTPASQIPEKQSVESWSFRMCEVVDDSYKMKIYKKTAFEKLGYSFSERYKWN